MQVSAAAVRRTRHDVRRPARLFGWSCALLAALAATALAQSSLGTLRGAVADSQGTPVPGALVRVVDESTGVTRETSADSRGAFEVSNLRAGSYRVEDASPGFIAFRATGVLLRAGEAALVNVKVNAPTQEVAAVTEHGEAAAPAPRKRAVEVVINAETRADIRLDTPAIQGGFDSQQLETLPRGSREFRDFLDLNPNLLAHPSGFQGLNGRSYGFSYLQDGQPSNGGLFGWLTYAAPGLDAIDEVKVFSSSYSAEFGGLSAIVVTSRRGGNRYSGTAFYDFNSDKLNALTYDQKQAGLERGFPGSDTRAQRYGLTLGGPLRTGRTFFLVGYEGGRFNEVGGGRLVSVPSARMRGGDFSKAGFAIRDPLTGQPFPGNVVPAGRIDPAALRVLDFFYPRPNLPDQANGMGRYQEFANLRSLNNLFDARLDHEFSRSDSLFVRGSWQRRDPGNYFEQPSFPQLGLQDRRLQDLTVASSWLHIFSSRLMNELRVGYNREDQNRRSHYTVGAVADALGIQAPEGSLDRRGLTSFLFTGANRIANIGGESFDTNANRDTLQSSFSVSDTLTWSWGAHSLRLGGLFSRDHVMDGFSLGANGAAGIFSFSGARTGNGLADLLLGLPSSSTEGINTRGLNPLDVRSNVFAAFVQDDWRVGNNLTLFAGLRYELVTPFVERKDLLVNFDPRSAQLVVPSAATIPYLTQDAALLPRAVAADVGLPRGLVRSDTNNLSPRLGFAFRPGGDNRTVVRGGAGVFYPTAAAQGIRDALSRSPFRASTRRAWPQLADGFTTGTPSTNVGANANAVAFDLQTPEFYQYNLTVERELPGGFGFALSYIGALKRKLLINRNLNTLPASSVPFDPENEADQARLPYPQLSTSVNSVQNGGSGHVNVLQASIRRRFRGGFGFEATYSLAGSRSTAPDLGNSSLGVVQYDPYDLSRNEGPDPTVVRHRFAMNATWELPVGRGRSFFSGMPPLLDALLGGWTVSGLVFARSGYHLTPFYSGIDEGGINPANTGAPLTNNDFDEAWRPDLVGDPNGPRTHDSFYNLAAFVLPAPGTTGNAPMGVIEGPGAFVVNLGIYKDLVRTRGFRLQLRVVLDNAFNHPQFDIPLVPDAAEPGFLNLSDYLVGGLPDGESNGTTNVLTEVGSTEGFASGRVVRFGLRAQF